MKTNHSQSDYFRAGCSSRMLKLRAGCREGMKTNYSQSDYFRGGCSSRNLKISWNTTRLVVKRAVTAASKRYSLNCTAVTSAQLYYSSTGRVLAVGLERITGFRTFSIVMVTKSVTQSFEDRNLSPSSGGGGIGTYKNKEQKDEKKGKKKLRIATFIRAGVMCDCVSRTRDFLNDVMSEVSKHRMNAGRNIGWIFGYEEKPLLKSGSYLNPILLPLPPHNSP
ncbi:hypothetical protein J6590_071278 [Homalodisca vitripennis]|nr:hypothetical protein J6590_071278 [Homalodisca vitripennis]